MARTMDGGTVVDIKRKAAIDKPNFKKIKQGLDGLMAKGETIKADTSEVGNMYSQLEDAHGLEKGGMKLAVTFGKMSEEKRHDRLRTLFICLKAMDAGLEKDLVDLMGELNK